MRVNEKLEWQLGQIIKICQSVEHRHPLSDIVKVCRDGQPKIVCLCGSTRFGEAFREWNLRETVAGNIVLSIGCNLKSDSDLMAAGLLKESDKIALDELHKRKIDLCDEVLVLNVGGYIGDSTRSEIQYAETNNKPIRYLEPLLVVKG